IDPLQVLGVVGLALLAVPQGQRMLEQVGFDGPDHKRRGVCLCGLRHVGSPWASRVTIWPLETFSRRHEEVGGCDDPSTRSPSARPGRDRALRRALSLPSHGWRTPLRQASGSLFPSSWVRTQPYGGGLLLIVTVFLVVLGVLVVDVVSVA